MESVQLFLNFLYTSSYIVGFLVLLIAILKIYLKLTRGKFKITRSLEGKVIIITGATDGIGKATARELSIHGATLHIAARNLEKAQNLERELKTETGNKQIFVHQMDLCSFRSIREFARKFVALRSPLHILINNAGSCPWTKQPTEDGLPEIMQSNHFGPFLLTQLLTDLLIKSGPGCRIVNLSSISCTKAKNVDLDDLYFEKQPYCPIIAYAWSKLFNVWHTRELARRLHGTGVTTNCLHPGFVQTSMTVRASTILKWVKLALPFAKTPEEGAQTVLHAALASELENVSGHYFSDCRLTVMPILALDDQLAEKLWDISVKITSLKK